MFFGNWWLNWCHLIKYAYYDVTNWFVIAVVVTSCCVVIILYTVFDAFIGSIKYIPCFRVWWCLFSNRIIPAISKVREDSIPDKLILSEMLTYLFKGGGPSAELNKYQYRPSVIAISERMKIPWSLIYMTSRRLNKNDRKLRFYKYS